MKRSEITRELGFIDPEFIAEAASYKPRRMNKIKVVALAACLAVIVTALPLSLIMNREDQVETPETTLTPGKDSTTSGNSDTVIVDPTPLKVIYCDASAVSPEYLETTVFKDKNIKVEDFVGFRYRAEWQEGYETIYWTPDIPEKLTLSLSNKEYTATFDMAFCDTNTDNEILKSYAKIARYKIDGTEKGYIYYNVGAKAIEEIIGLPISSISYQQYSPKYNKEEILEIACHDVKSIYGEEFSEEHYTIKHYSSSSGMLHVIRFEKMIGDYKTGSIIEVQYNAEGELKHCFSDNWGLYDFASHLLNEKKLSEVEKEAQELIGEKLVAEKQLMIHKDGYVCVRYIVYLGYYGAGATPATAYLYFRLE